jgi:hypothetical protein
VAQRLIRLLLAFLLFVPCHASGDARGARPDPAVVRHTSAQSSARPREVKLPALSRSGIKRQTGSGPLPHLIVPPLPGFRFSLATSGEKRLPVSAGAVLPRRLNRSLFSGTSPPLHG